MVEGWGKLHERFARLPWPELLQPAIQYARDGFPISDLLAGWIRGAEDVLRRWPASQNAMMPHGRPPEPGERLRQPDLAATLELLAEQGARALYHGDIAVEIGRAVAAADGLLSRDDLAAHCGDWTEPVGLRYRGLDVRVHGPNSQGWSLPLMLGLIADHDVQGLGLGTVDGVHLQVEAKRLAFADRDAYNTDPEHMPIDVRRLFDEGYLARRRSAIRLDRAAEQDPAPGTLDGDTTYFCIVDPERNALSVIQSLFHGFGTGFVAGSTGLFLQNRGAYFSLDAGHVNRLAPGKRTAHTLCAAMVLGDGVPAIVPGTMGGDGQPQILLQLLTMLIDHGLSPQTAIEFPRWVHGPGADGPTLSLEGRWPNEVVDGLRAKGHRVETIADWAPVCGHAQAIAISEHGLAGGADPRGDGSCAGW